VLGDTLLAPDEVLVADDSLALTVSFETGTDDDVLAVESIAEQDARASDTTISAAKVCRRYGPSTRRSCPARYGSELRVAAIETPFGARLYGANECLRTTGNRDTTTGGRWHRQGSLSYDAVSARHTYNRGEDTPVIGSQTIPTSFADFVAEVEPRLRTALCASFGPDQGRDSAAEALAYGWQHWERVRTMPNPAGYLWGVGRNHARRATRHRFVFPDVPTDEIPWVEPGLPSALADLSEKQRIAVTLVYGLEWTLSEVAGVLGVSKSTVQTQTERGMKKLRNSLGVEQ